MDLNKLSPRWFKLLMNLYPPFVFTRTKVKSISADWKEIVVELKKSILTRNYVGSTFGGALFQAADSFYMLMLFHLMDMKKHIVWDESAEIFFKKPARSKITYHFSITDEDLAKIHRDLEKEPVIHPTFRVVGIDEAGETCVIVDKVIYIRRK